MYIDVQTKADNYNCNYYDLSGLGRVKIKRDNSESEKVQRGNGGENAKSSGFYLQFLPKKFRSIDKLDIGC